MEWWMAAYNSKLGEIPGERSKQVRSTYTGESAEW